MERDVPTVVLGVGDRDDGGDGIYVAAGEDAIRLVGRRWRRVGRARSRHAGNARGASRAARRIGPAACISCDSR